ncbi:hypothetical protein [Herbaspirillum sp. SJZ107]|nr:hypothetical protein [Herbaspirillum sp. SJZ107]
MGARIYCNAASSLPRMAASTYAVRQVTEHPDIVADLPKCTVVDKKNAA